jgi:hypothetical protein
MKFLKILLYIFIIFIGYAIGRVGHIYFGYMNAPHHWILGFILIILGLIFRKHFLGLLILYFGIGYFISDFNDFLNFKIIGADDFGIKKFWGID